MHLTTGNIVLITIILMLLVVGSWYTGFVMGAWVTNDQWCNESLSNPWVFPECR